MAIPKDTKDVNDRTPLQESRATHPVNQADGTPTPISGTPDHASLPPTGEEIAAAEARLPAVTGEVATPQHQTLVTVSAPASTFEPYQEPAAKWVAFAKQWGQWSGGFATQFGLDSNAVSEAKGDRDALAKVMEQTLRVPVALAYQDIDAYVSTLRV